jgi:hypothetical protein
MLEYGSSGQIYYWLLNFEIQGVAILNQKSRQKLYEFENKKSPVI